MILRNVETQYAFIIRPDENGNYRVSFKPSSEDRKALNDLMVKTAEDNGVKDTSKLDWWGSEKDEWFSAKCSKEFTTKKGETIVRELPVYDIHARLIDRDSINGIANGAICNIEVEPYFASYKQKKGVMLGLRSIQLINFKEYSAENPYNDESPDNAYTDENVSNVNRADSSKDDTDPWNN